MRLATRVRSLQRKPARYATQALALEAPLRALVVPGTKVVRRPRT